MRHHEKQVSDRRLSYNAQRGTRGVPLGQSVLKDSFQILEHHSRLAEGHAQTEGVACPLNASRINSSEVALVDGERKPKD